MTHDDASPPVSPLLTPEQAEARAAAVIAQYRNEAGRTRSSSRSAFPPPGFAWAIIYVAGVVGGTVFHAKPLVAIAIGAPLLLVVRSLMARHASSTKAETK